MANAEQRTVLEEADGPDLRREQLRQPHSRRREYAGAAFVRGSVREAIEDCATFFRDGRMTAQVVRVLTACDPAGREHYPTTLFATAEAYQGTGTAKTTIYRAKIAAGLMPAQFTKHLRGLPIDPDIQFARRLFMSHAS